MKRAVVSEENITPSKHAAREGVLRIYCANPSYKKRLQ